MSTSIPESCPMCNFLAPTTSLWLSHIRSVHSTDANFQINCCSTSYNKCPSFVSHMYRRHRDLLTVQRRTYESSAVDLPAQSDPQCSEITEMHSNIESHEQHAINQLLGNDAEAQKKVSALFLLHLKESKGLSQSAVNEVVVASQKLFNHTMGRIQAGVMDCLSKNGLVSSDLPGLDNVFKSVQDPFSGLTSTFLQEKYYREELKCIVPIQVRVGRGYYKSEKLGFKRRKVLKHDTYSYIPVKSLMQQLLKNSEICDQVSKVRISSDGILRDYCDGQIFKEHPVFQRDQNALQIVVYYDEIELCNPLGSSNKKHKVGCIFLSLGNLHPNMRSSLDSMFLVAVGSSKVINKHGINEFLKVFVKDINELSQTGVHVEFNNESKHYNIALLAFLADNLAAHQLGGFKESMSFAFRICRSCMATRSSSQRNFRENDFELRNDVEHTRQCQLLTGPMQNHYSVSFGINRRSMLEEVENFSVVKNIPHDIMHDLFEGIVPRELKCILEEFCIKSNFFTVKTFNQRLINFDYGQLELCDKPAEIDEASLKKPEANIRQSASQMSLLLTIIPFLVVDLIPQENPHWSCFLLLLKICQICLSWQIDINIIDYLQILIEEHHTIFTKLYPQFSITPKMHYMIHYPQQIRMFGPLVNTWTMRYEGKLSVIKKASCHGNFKNICLTIAKRHQHHLCYLLNSSNKFLNKDEYDCNSSNAIEMETDLLHFITQNTQISVSNSLFKLKCLKHNSIMYTMGVFVFFRKGNLYPRFSKILDIYVLETQVIIKVKLYETKCFDSLYNAFVIEELPQIDFLLIEQVPEFPVLHARKSFAQGDNKIYILPRQFIVV